MKQKLPIAKYLFFLFTLLLFSCGIPYSDWSGLLSGRYPVKGKGPTLSTQLGYSEDDIIVIVHADDIGIHKDQTDGALDSMKMGMVKTGSVMVPCPDFERVASIWKDNPELDLGLHLTLTSGHRENYRWKPLLHKSKIPSLYDTNGYTWLNTKELVKHWNIHEALMELEAQIIKALQAGLKPTHIDNHQAAYNLHPDLAKEVMKLSRKYNLPMIPHPYHMEEMRKKGYVFPDTYWMFLLISGEKNNPAYRKKVYDRWLRNLKPGVHQMIVHPSFMSDEYEQYVWPPHVLTGDHAYWTSAETKALAEELGIVFIGLRELQKLQAKNWNLSTDGVVWKE
jgi:predicted glycoside hydrolase/deacetylase ChbG (UPF0249 family)